MSAAEGSHVMPDGVTELRLVESVPNFKEPAPDDTPFRRILNIGANVISICHTVVDTAGELIHEAIHGNYSDKFKQEFKQRHCFETSDGVKLTARILNPEFLENNEHAVVYSFSLGVPGNHGVEIPTLADIASHGEATGRAVIAITTDGLAGATNPNALLSLADFWKMPKRRFEVLRELLPPDKRLIVTGSSLGGMMSHALASVWEEEADYSGYKLEVTHDIAVASAGHHRYILTDLPEIGLQFVAHESRATLRYVRKGESAKDKVQRTFELVGTVPRHPSQYAAIAFTGISILRAPLQGVEHRIPHSTIVRDITFDDDGVTHPSTRPGLWSDSNHPNVSHERHAANHVDGLLTVGRRRTIEELRTIPSNFSR